MIDKSIFVKEKSSTKFKQIKAEAILERQKQKLEQEVNSSNIDDKLKELIKLQEEVVDDSDASKEIEKAINNYVEQNKLKEEQLKEFKKINTQLKHIKKIAEVKEDLQDINDDFSLGTLFQKLKQGKAKTYITKKAKESLNIGNIIKGAIHGAGVALDAPALNILASELKTETKSNVDVANKLDNILNEKEVEKTITNNEKEITTNNEKKSTFMSDEIVDINKKQLDHLSAIDNKFTSLDKSINDVIFMQKDKANDEKISDVTSIQPQNKNQKSNLIKPKKEDDGFGLLDLIGAGTIGKQFKGKGINLVKTAGSAIAGVGSAVSGIGSAIAGVASKVAIPLLVAKGAYDTFKGVEKAKEDFDLKQNQEATIGQKISAGTGGLVSGLTFGMIDQKEATKKIHKVRDWASEHGPIGFIRNLTTSKESMRIAESLEDKGVVDLSVIGDSKIRDWGTVRKLPKNQIKALIEYDDWDDKTEKQLRSIFEAKSKQLVVNKPNEQTNIKNINNNASTQLNEARNLTQQKETNVQRQQVQNERSQSQPTIIQQKEPNSQTKMADYSIETNDLVEMMLLQGVRL